jgi:predicted lysophospholipase L1 biosynthesis ABC-type transport system permease subunit
MQIPRIMGREFNDHDVTGSPAVAIVNESFVKRFGLEHPIDRTAAIGNTSYRIVGVVGDAKFMSMRNDFLPMVYLCYLQTRRPPGQMTYELRTQGDPRGHAETVRRIVQQFDSRMAISDMGTLAAHVDEAISREITLARLCSAFAALALLIACVGLYGTVAYNVERRTGEIGVRVALGAQRPTILWMILREVLVLALIALAIGAPVALAGGRIVKSLLYGIPPNDPVTIAFSAVALLTAGLLAAYLPARRASRINPMTAVRQE